MLESRISTVRIPISVRGVSRKAKFQQVYARREDETSKRKWREKELFSEEYKVYCECK